MRICYAYFEDHAVVFLIRAYGKTVKDDLTGAEKKVIRQLLERISQELSARPAR